MVSQTYKSMTMLADDKSILQWPENIRLKLSGVEKVEMLHRRALVVVQLSVLVSQDGF